MMLTRNEAAKWLLARDHFCILTHRRPDGDTVGSAAALCLGLRQLGKTAHILENPQLTARYASYHTGLTCAVPAEGDTLVSVDVAAPRMLCENHLCWQDRVALRIDHHASAVAFTPSELVEPDTAACGEIIWEVLCEMGVKLTKDIAEAIYVAVSTDTGCFRYSNTTAHTFQCAAACAEAGVELSPINHALFECRSLARLRLESYMLENAQFFADGKLALCAIPLAIEQKFGVTEDDGENISGFPRAIQGVMLAVTLRELPDGATRLSVRSAPGYDAAALCAKFGGGGHVAAAGATTRLSLEETQRQVASYLREMECK